MDEEEEEEEEDDKEKEENNINVVVLADVSPLGPPPTRATLTASDRQIDPWSTLYPTDPVHLVIF